jgi:hypothetical protein
MRKLTIPGQVRRNDATVLNTTQICSLQTFGDGEIQVLSDVLIDCVEGGDAERLYAKLGWQPCGVIPRFALLPGGGFCDTKFFYRSLKEPV